MEIKKENVLQEFIKMIQNSWTYQKMTGWEKDKIINILNDERIETALKGNTKARWEILQAIYFTYLQAIGYTDFNWREEKTDDKPSF